jgi:hypothetical protein
MRLLPMTLRPPLSTWHLSADADLDFEARAHEWLQDVQRVHLLRRALYDAGHATAMHRLSDHEVLAFAITHFTPPRRAAARLLPLVVREPAGASSASSAVTPSQLVPRRAETHWVQFNVADRRGNPVGGLPFRLLDPGASVLEKDTLPMSGKLRKDGVEPGRYTLELGELTGAAWQVDGRPVSGPLPAKTALSLAVASAHVPPGTAAKFKVFHLYDEEPGRALATVDAKVGGDGAIVGSFTFAPGDADRGREVALIYSCTVGKLWVKSPPLTLALPALRAARWSADEATVGDAATLAVDAPGIADGENVHFTVFRADTGAAVAELDAPVRGGAAQAAWPTVDPDPETPESEVYFEAACAGLSTRSRTMRLLDDVELVFETADGQPLANARVQLEYGDGTRRTFQTDGAGVLRLTDPRARTARIEVGEAEEVTER